MQAADLTQEADVERAAAAIAERFGEIDAHAKLT
jgi:NAD(P)-dependent dehydrogenase (short-subunit alcohol dehydrogenase family)